jgi:SanA protein
MQRARNVFGVEDAIVCTQAVHLPRTLYLAEAAGIEATGFAADRRAYAHARYQAARESVASLAAVLDTWLQREPRYWGPAIPIDGSAYASLDARGLGE